MIPAFRFTEQNWKNLERNWTAWWEGELDRPMVMMASPHPKRIPEELTLDFLLHKPVEDVLDYYDARLSNTTLLGDAFPRWFPFFGAGVLAAFLGAELLCAPDHGTIWFEPSAAFDPDLELHPDPHNIWWNRIRQLTQAAVQRWGDRVCVGFTDLGGNLDILASLRGSQHLLTDLVDCPEKIESASKRVTQLWQEYYNELWAITRHTGRGSSPWAPIWTPGKCYMLQSDFSAMISPRMFKRYVLPDIAACCQGLDYAFYHLDGKGQLPHLDMLLGVENLHGIQWIPGEGQPPPEDWLPVLKRIRDAGKLCQLYVSANGARQIVQNLGGKGFAFYLMDNLSPAEAQALVIELGWRP